MREYSNTWNAGIFKGLRFVILLSIIFFPIIFILRTRSILKDSELKILYNHDKTYNMDNVLDNFKCWYVETHGGITGTLVALIIGCLVLVLTKGVGKIKSSSASSPTPPTIK